MRRRIMLSGCFIIFVILVLAIVNYYNQSSNTPIIKAKFQNVFKDNLKNDWKEIQSSLKVNTESYLQSFEIDYLVKGDLTRIDWTLAVKNNDNSAIIYHISREPNQANYNAFITKGSFDSTNKITTEAFINLFDKDSISTMTPDSEDVSYVSLRFDPVIKYINNNENIKVFAVKGLQIDGPLKSGQGYVVSLFPMNQQNPKNNYGGTTDRYYMLGRN